MKKLLSISAAILIFASCSNTETAPDAPAADGSMPEPSVSDSSAPAPEAPAAEAPTENLSTPVSDAPDSSAFDGLLADGEKPKSSAPADASTPASSDSLFAPGEGSEAKDATIASSNTSDPMPAPESSVTSAEPSSSLPAPVDPTGANYNANAYNEAKRIAPPKKMTYEQFREREIARNESEKDMEDVTLYAHEAGKFQFALEYIYKPFDGFDFDKGSGIQKGKTTGGGLSFTYFPIHELSIGRFGLGAHGGVFWTKFDRNTISTSSMGINATGSRHAIDVFGGHAVYEFQYFLGQIVVPFATAGYDRILISTQNRSGTSNEPMSQALNSAIYGGGFHLNLNRLEPTTAAKGLPNMGIRKFYLSYTYLIRDIASNKSVNNVLGLRFEY